MVSLRDTYHLQYKRPARIQGLATLDNKRLFYVNSYRLVGARVTSYGSCFIRVC